MTLPDWDALPVRTKRSRKRIYAVLKGEYNSLTAWKSLNINVKRSKIHLHNYIASVLNLDTYDELNKQFTRSTRLWYNYIKTNASSDSPTLTITVTDGTSAVSSASVKIGSTTQTTNGEGKATFTGLTYGDYDCKVTKTGYYDLDDTVRFRANHKNFTLALSELPTLTVTVTDDGETPTAISGATVTINDVEKTTNDSGEATFKLDYGDYEASVSATGYTTATTELAFRINKKTFNITLTEVVVETGTVTVTCMYDGEEWEGTDVFLMDGETQVAIGYSDINGVAILTDDTSAEPIVPKQIPYGTYTLRGVYADIYTYEGSFIVDSATETVTITLTSG